MYRVYMSNFAHAIDTVQIVHDDDDAINLWDMRNKKYAFEAIPWTDVYLAAFIY